MTIHYFEHYPHYMGTKNAEVKFTKKEFDEIVNLSNAAIKEHKKDDSVFVQYEKLDAFVSKIQKKQKETCFALLDALLNYFNSPRRPASIVKALDKKGVWSGEWEEGSFAFSNKSIKKARKAVAKIEAQHTMDEFE